MPARSFTEGLAYGRLTCLEPYVEKRGRLWYGLWACACGNTTLADNASVRYGGTQSCGCLVAEVNTKHGHAKRGSYDRTYQSWVHMKSRCDDTKNDNYYLYGARGIGYCTHWETFESFLEDMGERPAGKSLDRIDTNGAYCKDNCRWATPKEQAANRRTTRGAGYEQMAHDSNALHTLR